MVMPDECVICGNWPEPDRWVRREMIDELPLEDNVCDECLKAFWKNWAPQTSAED